MVRILGYMISLIARLFRYDLNFDAFGTFSPLKTLSAPTFLPLAGHPYFGPNNLFHMLQEDIEHISVKRRRKLRSERAFIETWIVVLLERYKSINILPILQAGNEGFDEWTKIFDCR